MTLDFVKRNKLLFSLALIYRMLVVKRMNRIQKTIPLKTNEKEALEILKRDGIVAIPNYFTSEECDIMKAEFDRLVDKHSVYCEENERRVFGMNRLSQKVENLFSKDRFAWNVCESYLGEAMELQTTMSARIDYKENVKYGSGGSWHRDSYSRQIKAITYLTDMTDDNGPFMYINKSHKILNVLKDVLRSKKKDANYSRYSEKEIDGYLHKFKQEITYFPCNKGTLILADIRGLHTTRYLKSGFAYSIFNYYIAQYDDNFKNSDLGVIESKCINKEFANEN